uniref:protein acetyllysine N-acetyltransferase n=1 Tax=Zooxanthella nutricula TaxID=1333877 RepID=A0A6V0FH47_9DINO
MVRSSKHMVVFTGAGMSTSAGISDFRGPNGVWTRKARGQEPIVGTSTVKACPTNTHMGIVELHRRGVVKHVISQNCDGLHRRSGIPANAVSELHGNSNIEICEDCGCRYFRDFKATRRVRTFDHFTGRFCPLCEGRLLESTIDFGQDLPTKPLKKAEKHSRLADLHVVFGSSLTVSPACDLPEQTADKGLTRGRLVIVNKQKTPLTPKASLHIHASTDLVMEALMRNLTIPIPSFTLWRRIIFGCEGGYVYAKAVDPHAPKLEIGALRNVDWVGKTPESPASKRAQTVWTSLVHRCPKEQVVLNDMHPTLHFVGHYQEPSLCLDLNLATGDKDVLLGFDPTAGQWSVAAVNDWNAGAPCGEDRDADYGASHRKYVVSKRREQGYADAAKQVEQEFEEARQNALKSQEEQDRVRANHSAIAELQVARAREFASQQASAGVTVAGARDRVPHQAAAETKVANVQDRTRRQAMIEAQSDGAFRRVLPGRGEKLECLGLPGQYKKLPSAEHRNVMVQHARECDHASCSKIWSGPWGEFIGGDMGRTHFDLTECHRGRGLNEAIGWNYDNPRV